MKRIIIGLATVALLACAHEQTGAATTTSVTIPPATTSSPIVAPAPTVDTRADDGRISSAIYGGILGDPELAPTAQEVDITAIDGNVVLSGRVRSERERTKLVLKARNTPGVQNVDDRLEVVP